MGLFNWFKEAGESVKHTVSGLGTMAAGEGTVGKTPQEVKTAQKKAEENRKKELREPGEGRSFFGNIATFFRENGKKIATSVVEGGKMALEKSKEYAKSVTTGVGRGFGKAQTTTLIVGVVLVAGIFVLLR